MKRNTNDMRYECVCAHIHLCICTPHSYAHTHTDFAAPPPCGHNRRCPRVPTPPTRVVHGHAHARPYRACVCIQVFVRLSFADHGMLARAHGPGRVWPTPTGWPRASRAPTALRLRSARHAGRSTARSQLAGLPRRPLRLVELGCCQSQSCHTIGATCSPRRSSRSARSSLRMLCLHSRRRSAPAGPQRWALTTRVCRGEAARTPWA